MQGGSKDRAKKLRGRRRWRAQRKPHAVVAARPFAPLLDPTRLESRTREARKAESLEELPLERPDSSECLDAEEALACEAVLGVTDRGVKLRVRGEQGQMVALEHGELALRLVGLVAPLHG